MSQSQEMNSTMHNRSTDTNLADRWAFVMSQSQEMDTLYTTGQRLLTLWTGGTLSRQSQEMDTLYTTGQRLLTLQTGGSGVGGHVAVTGDGVPLLHTAPTVGTGVVLAL